MADPEPMHQVPLALGDRSSQRMAFGQQVGDSLPDLRGLMYPSANPFAYGNQPLSILEDSQTMASEHQPSSFMESTGETRISPSNFGPHNVPLDSMSNGAFQNQAQHIAYRQAGQNATIVQRRTSLDFQIAQQSNAEAFETTNLDGGYWQQLNKGHAGWTPGINLEELFGSDGGWILGYMNPGFGRTQ
jgi:hypothetical protein